MGKHIDRAALLNSLSGAKTVEEIFAAIQAAPAEDVEPVRRGRWEHYEHREPQYDIMGVKTWAEAYKCSNCGFIHTVIEDFGHYAFCPNCGAIMDKEENE